MMLGLGCSSGPERPDAGKIQSDMEAFSNRSEAPLPTHEEGVLQEDQWHRGRRNIEISFKAPSQPGSYPLVIYFPGLGQNAAAGVLWKNAWVRAGFAVLTVQGERDAHALHGLSREDRMDLRSVGRPYFSSAEIEERIRDFDYVIQELRKRSHAGSQPYDKVITSEFAVAGFDLGAQTVQALIGEKIRGNRLPETAGSIRSAILLSPHVDVAAGGIQQRFREIQTPLLVITGTNDHDPWGISSPSVRQAPWQQAASHRKILVNLTRATHRQMAGIDPSSQRPEDLEADPEEIQARQDQEENPVKTAMRQLASNGRPMPFRDQQTTGDPRHPGQQLSAIQWISAAFLSETLKQDQASGAWLRNKAPSWLSGAGVIQNR